MSRERGGMMQLILLKIVITLIIPKNGLYFLHDILEIEKSETKRKGGMKITYALQGGVAWL